VPSRQGVGTAAQGSARADPYDLARGSAAPLSVRIANTHFGMGYEQECRPRSGFASMRRPAECSAGVWQESRRFSSFYFRIPNRTMWRISRREISAMTVSPSILNACQPSRTELI
jgi:hypothetical protein